MKTIEKELTKKSKETLFNLPIYVTDYIEEIKDSNSPEELGKIIDSLYHYYTNLYLIMHKIINGITPKDIDLLGLTDMKRQILNLNSIQITHIANFQQFLVKSKMLSKQYIFSNTESTESKRIRKQIDALLNDDGKNLKTTERLKQIISFNNLIDMADKVTSNPKYIIVINAALSGKRNCEIAKQIGAKSPSQIPQMLSTYIRWCKKYTGLWYFTDKPPIPNPYNKG
ncbi:hypothetical protein SAMN02910298_00216 [Pseudobutyrivibrio sp. YE44]|uniref:hypothetical protein n=1 Tax=Pseudobutyrivibrio sp. YE44 TaxID=1520802 RepID=UPI0008818AC7|nr:hypothetical protein [Pseudobutyrivibrio sp. YE44]SDB07015.1 hypothetical protein SAMN02910298_00216 [Pseudobutyrivibrio sp. YE44]